MVNAHGVPPPAAAAGSAADSGSAAATPRSPAAAMQAAAVAAVPGPGTAVMMAPRAMAVHPGFWMYPGGATAQWPMAYPPNWAPYAYGYYPFQVG
jgi:hypothetical protein